MTRKKECGCPGPALGSPCIKASASLNSVLGLVGPAFRATAFSLNDLRGDIFNIFNFLDF
jgi:hypothetical protein